YTGPLRITCPPGWGPPARMVSKVGSASLLLKALRATRGMSPVARVALLDGGRGCALSSAHMKCRVRACTQARDERRLVLLLREPLEVVRATSLACFRLLASIVATKRCSTLGELVTRLNVKTGKLGATLAGWQFHFLHTFHSQRKSFIWFAIQS